MHTTTLELRSPETLLDHMTNMRDSGRATRLAALDDDGIPMLIELNEMTGGGLRLDAVIGFGRDQRLAINDVKFPVKVLHAISSERRPGWDAAMGGGR